MAMMHEETTKSAVATVTLGEAFDDWFVWFVGVGWMWPRINKERGTRPATPTATARIGR